MRFACQILFCVAFLFVGGVATSQVAWSMDEATLSVTVSLAEPPPPFCFTPVNPTGRTQPVFIVDAEICGTQVEEGDWVGIFDGDLCVGAGKVTELPMVDPIVAYLRYVPPVGDPLPGAQDGNPISFRICDVSNENVCYATPTNVLSGPDPPVFQEGVISAVTLKCVAVQQLELQEGVLDWFSFNAELLSNDAMEVLSDLSDLIIVQNASGGVYIPPNVVFPGHPGTDTLSPLNVCEGYQMFLSGSGSQILDVSGCRAVDSCCVSLLPSALNWIPCPYQAPVSISDVFNETTAPDLWSDLVIVQSETGGVLVPPNIVFPGHPGTNTIGNMVPGEAYKLFHSADVAIDCCYPELGLAEGKSLQEPDYTLTMETQDLGFPKNTTTSPFVPVAPTGRSQPVYILGASLDGTSLGPGDEVGVFDGTLCVGVYMVESPWSYDPTTVYLEYTPPVGDPLPGAEEDNLMRFVSWDSSEGLEHEMTVSDVTTGPDPPVFHEAVIVALSLSYFSPAPTDTHTPVPPTPTNTFTLVPPTPTDTFTPVPPTPTDTDTPLPPTPTHTPEPPTATYSSTATPVPPTGTFTPTDTPVPPTVTNTPTATLVPPTSTYTPTDTAVPPTATYTPTETPVHPTATYTPTNTPVPPTATYTPTDTPVPPTATYTPTDTPVPPTATNTPTDTPMFPTTTSTPTDTPVAPTPTTTEGPTATLTPTEVPPNKVPQVALLEVSFRGVNRAPVIVDVVGAATDEDGLIVEYAWSFEDEGVFDATGTVLSATVISIASHEYVSAGTYEIGFWVWDDEVEVAAATTEIVVASFEERGDPPQFYSAEDLLDLLRIFKEKSHAEFEKEYLYEFFEALFYGNNTWYQPETKGAVGGREGGIRHEELTTRSP